MNTPKILRTIATAALMVAVAVGCASKSEAEDTTLRVLYWNFQNGMWSDEPNGYNNFAAWVRRYDPDVCIWCAASWLWQEHEGVRYLNGGHSVTVTRRWMDILGVKNHYVTKDGTNVIEL